MSDGWIKTDRGWKKRYSPQADAVQPGSFPCPRIVRQFSAPVKSMADGKYYDDPASLRATYKASGNPQGVDYAEVGNEDITTFTPPKKDRKANRDAIARAIADVDAGRVPPVLNKAPV